MKLPLPPWEPGYSRQKLKTWFIKQLELSYELSADDLWQEVQMQNDDAFNAAIMQLGQRHSKRRQVIAAAKAKDLDELVRLGAANDPKLAMLAFRQFTRKPGRQRGDPRPRDLSDVERTAREDALEEVDRMRLIAKWHWKRFEGFDDIFVEIATDRAGITPDQLSNYRKSRSRKIK